MTSRLSISLSDINPDVCFNHRFNCNLQNNGSVLKLNWREVLSVIIFVHVWELFNSTCLYWTVFSHSGFSGIKITEEEKDGSVIIIDLFSFKASYQQRFSGADVLHSGSRRLLSRTEFRRWSERSGRGDVISVADFGLLVAGWRGGGGGGVGLLGQEGWREINGNDGEQNGRDEDSWVQVHSEGSVCSPDCTSTHWAAVRRSAPAEQLRGVSAHFRSPFRVQHMAKDIYTLFYNT